jgi:DNA polymerase I
MTGVPLLLVDGHNLLFRACFGTPAQIFSRDPTDKRDITTQFMFFALLRKGINDELGHWPEVMVIFDGQDGAAGRKDTDPLYKATRPASPEALRPILALPDVKTGLDTYGITWIEIDDAEAEADDVIATLVTAHPSREILIASMDQDYYQLLRDPGPGGAGVRVLNTAMRPGARLIGPAEVIARYGITPGQYPDFRALCGDASDNIPGVRGVGAKTAATLLPIPGKVIAQLGLWQRTPTPHNPQPRQARCGEPRRRHIRPPGLGARGHGPRRRRRAVGRANLMVVFAVRAWHRLRAVRAVGRRCRSLSALAGLGRDRGHGAPGWQWPVRGEAADPACRRGCESGCRDGAVEVQGMSLRQCG